MKGGSCLTNPAGISIAARWGVLGGAASFGLQRGSDCTDEPRIDRKPFPGGRLLDPQLDVVGQAKCGSRRTTLIAVIWDRLAGRDGCSGPALGNVLESWDDRWWRDNELGVASAEAHIDRARCELAGDLARGDRQCLQQNEPGSRLEGRGEALGEGAGLLTACFGGNFKLVLKIVDVLSQIHDTIVMSVRRHVKSKTAQVDVILTPATELGARRSAWAQVSCGVRSLA